jgi:hypothetical protein
MSSDDYCETCIMVVFWCWLPDHHMMFATFCIMIVLWCLLPDHRMMFATCWWTGGVNYVVMSCYEMSSYYANLA